MQGGNGTPRYRDGVGQPIDHFGQKDIDGFEIGPAFDRPRPNWAGPDGDPVAFYPRRDRWPLNSGSRDR